MVSLKFIDNKIKVKFNGDGKRIEKTKNGLL